MAYDQHFVGWDVAHGVFALWVAEDDHFSRKRNVSSTTLFMRASLPEALQGCLGPLTSSDLVHNGSVRGNVVRHIVHDKPSLAVARQDDLRVWALCVCL